MRNLPTFSSVLWFYVFLIWYQCAIGTYAIRKRHLDVADDALMCTEKACDDDDGIQVETVAGK